MEEQNARENLGSLNGTFPLCMPVGPFSDLHTPSNASLPLRVTFQIQGMQNSECALVIERQLQLFAGVQHAHVDAQTGNGKLWCSQLPSFSNVQRVLGALGYTILPSSIPACLPNSDAPPTPHALTQRIRFQIEGIHCSSCVTVIERKLKKLEGVQEVQVEMETGKGEMQCSRVPRLEDAQDMLRANGYTILPRSEQPHLFAQAPVLTPPPSQPLPLTAVPFQIEGMHCASCEFVIESELRKLEGVQAVQVNARTGKGKMQCTRVPPLYEAQQTLRAHGYTILPWSETPHPTLPARATERNTPRDYLVMGVIALLLVGLYQVFSRLNLIPAGPAIADQLGYGAIFVIGLVASVSSCMGAAGGLLVGMVATARKAQASAQQGHTLQATILFNLGRVLSYTTFGAVIGALGSVFTLSPTLNGIAVLVAGMILLLLGLRLLRFLGWLRLFQPRMPAFMRQRMERTGGTSSGLASFLLGAGSFFLPCGFTQALQLYVLSKGSPTVGALTMLVFALGTLPALLSFGALSSLVKGAVLRTFVQVSGVMVLFIGLMTVSSGFALLGMPLSPLLFGQTQQMQRAPLAPLINGKQVVTMKVQGLTYLPSMFTVRQGIPVKWIVDGSQAQDCARVLTIPDLGLTVSLPTQGTKTIVFVPRKTGNLRFSCPMAITTAGAMFMVVPAQTTPDSMSHAHGTNLGVTTLADCGLPPSLHYAQPMRSTSVPALLSRPYFAPPTLALIRENAPVTLLS